MSFSRGQVIAIGVAGIVLLFFVLVFLGVIPGLRTPGDEERQEVIIWGPFDEAGALSEAMGNIPFRYRQVSLETYETELVNALAAGQGPDVFLAHHTWLPKHYDKMLPLLDERFTLTDLRAQFPTVVEQDFAPDNGLIYALPLSIDTLALLYNRDFFDSAGIAVPPKTWVEFQEMVPKLRKLDSQGKLARAAAAIGGSPASINRATDLLMALMLQSGVQMVDANFTAATFAAGGLAPLNYYVSFANSASPAFTWNDQLTYSLDAFSEERTAAIFNYSYQRTLLRDKFPFLPVGVAPFPQPVGAAKEVAFANYWGFAVSKATPRARDAWRFILDLTTDSARARAYMARTGRPPALRTLIQEKLADPELGVFARQALSARSWPQVDTAFVEQTFGVMIQAVLAGKPSRDAIDEAQAAITARMQARNVQ